MHKVSLRIVTMPIQSQGIITRDNVSVDVSAVAYFKVVDAVKSVLAIENVRAAINQIAQTTLRKVVGQHTLDQTLAETDTINLDIRKILDTTTADWGVEVTLVELKDIQLPDSMKRAMARQAEAEREKRAKIINAEGESLAAAALGDASDTMMAHRLRFGLGEFHHDHRSHLSSGASPASECRPWRFDVGSYVLYALVQRMLRTPGVPPNPELPGSGVAGHGTTRGITTRSAR